MYTRTTAAAVKMGLLQGNCPVDPGEAADATDAVAFKLTTADDVADKRLCFYLLWIDLHGLDFIKEHHVVKQLQAV